MSDYALTKLSRWAVRAGALLLPFLLLPLPFLHVLLRLLEPLELPAILIGHALEICRAFGHQCR